MKTSPARWLFPALFILGAGMLGWWIGRGPAEQTGGPESGDRTQPRIRISDAPNRATKQGERPATREERSLEELLLGLPNERLVRFGSEEAYRRFLAGLDGTGVRLLGTLDQLRVARIGYGDLSDLDGLLDEAETFLNYYVTVPDLPDVSAQPGSVGFGDQLLAWLGIREDNSGWGSGILIAILDTGVTGHRALPDGIRQIDLVSGESAVPLNGHGTAVASLIVGQSGLTRGIAPGADLLSVRIGDQNGGSNSFTLAEGIIAAADAGAQLINISMGSYGDSVVVRDAIAYARSRGALLFASSGNEGLQAPAYPAANEGVVAVGAIDAGSNHLAFSNLGSTLGAPGYGINAAWTDEKYTLFSGTSASAPVVTAAVAATASQMNLSPVRAYELVSAHLNEAGAPGVDPAYGSGVLNLGRVMQSGTPGIYDAAAASNHFVPPAAENLPGTLLVTFENRGTERLLNAPATITLPTGTYSYTLTNLAPGATKTFETPLYYSTTTQVLEVGSAVQTPTGQTDRQPANNTLSTVIQVRAPEEGAP